MDPKHLEGAIIPKYLPTNGPRDQESIVRLDEPPGVPCCVLEIVVFDVSHEKNPTLLSIEILVG